MKKNLLRIIRCPQCHGRLKLHINEESGGEIREGSLNCHVCSRVYKITRFIPRFVSSDLYSRSFSIEWNIFSKTQLDREGEYGSTEATFVQKTGVNPKNLSGKRVLEAGCGMGRFLDLVSRTKAGTVVGFDLSLAVEAAYGNVGFRPNVHILQADVMAPPFSSEIFDFIFSIGVLHHTSDPERAFRSLVPFLKRNGVISVWVYGRFRQPPLSDFYRIFTSRMPWTFVLAVSRILTNLHPIYKRLNHLQVIIPISPEADPERRLLDIFDWYSPKYQYKFTIENVVRWFKRSELREIKTLSVPVSVTGKK